ncbi:MAG: bifunctional 5,10-methylenetetrahydrofolate dehydrogenase/5,10-methenyltetrahydrofolate cyclohydrolase [Anaerovoracaceae bacterium]
MTVLLKGKEVADHLTDKLKVSVKELHKKGVDPTLAIIRVGKNPSDLSYEKGAMKRAEKVGVTVKNYIFNEEITQEQLIDEIYKINKDTGIHGILIFRPLPKHMDDQTVGDALAPEKDVDGITTGSLAGVFMGNDLGFPPCTARACMEILDYNNVDLKGKKVTVLGRSLVIGKPVAMMTMEKHATVTICHSRTKIEDLKKASREAEVLIVALGKVGIIGKDHLSHGQIILDVGINVTEEGTLQGDVDMSAAEEKNVKITPVPGGIGGVTTAVLMLHLVLAAQKWERENG